MICNIMDDGEYDDFIKNADMGKELEDTVYYKNNHKPKMSVIETETLLEVGILFYQLQQASLKIKIAKIQLGESNG